MTDSRRICPLQGQPTRFLRDEFIWSLFAVVVQAAFQRHDGAIKVSRRIRQSPPSPPHAIFRGRLMDEGRKGKEWKRLESNLGPDRDKDVRNGKWPLNLPPSLAS